MPSVETSTRDTDKNPGITVLEKRGGLGSGAQKKARGSAGGEAGQGEEGEQTGRGGRKGGWRKGREKRHGEEVQAAPAVSTRAANTAPQAP